MSVTFRRTSTGSGLDQSLRATTRFKTVFEWFRVMEDEERREREKRERFSGVPAPRPRMGAASRRASRFHCQNPRVETKPLRMLVDFDYGAGEREALDIGQLSDGYRTHFSLVVDVARRMVQLNPSADLSDPARGTNSEAVVLIDEVDLHLDPPWQSRVIRGLSAAFPNAQLVVTTHSEQVLGSVEAESVRKLTWGDGEILVENVPFAQGATGEQILVELMGAPERVPGPVTAKLPEVRELGREWRRLGERCQGSTRRARGRPPKRADAAPRGSRDAASRDPRKARREAAMKHVPHPVLEPPGYRFIVQKTPATCRWAARRPRLHGRGSATIALATASCAARC